MSTDATPLDDSELKVPSRFTHWFDLYAMWGMLVFMAAFTVLGILDSGSGFDAPFWISIAILLGYVVLVWTTTDRHQVMYCPHCIADFPLNPGEVAAGRARFTLRYLHLVYGGLHTLFSFLDYTLRNKFLNLLGFALIAMGVFLALSTVLREWFGMFFVLVVVTLTHAKQRHTQLALWCPWCQPRGGGGNDDDDDPEPEPDPPDPGIGVETDQLSKTG